MGNIKNQIKVVNGQGNALRPTYIKRARQLVKNERATWVYKDTICLLEQNQEENIVEPRTTETAGYRAVDNGHKQLDEAATVLDDKSVLDLAKRRLAAKKNLIGQVLDFCLIFVVLLILVGLYHEDDKIVVVLAFSSFWSGRLILRIIKFAKPSFKNGIAAYFREREARKLEIEYNRLKKMTSESVAAELSKQV